MSCGCQGTKKVSSNSNLVSSSKGGGSGKELFGKSKLTVTKKTTKKATRMTFAKK